MENHFINHLEEVLKNNKQYNSTLRKISNLQKIISVNHIDGFVFSYFLKDIVSQTENNILVIVPSEQEIKKIISDLRLLGQDSVLFPSNGKSILSIYKNDNTLTSEQIDSMYDILHKKHTIIFSSLRGLIYPLKGIDNYVDNSFMIKKGMDVTGADIPGRLSEMGYYRVPRTTIEGEFTMRGEVLDIFPPGTDSPFRIVFNWDEISSIRKYDPLSQNTLPQESEGIEIFPYRYETEENSMLTNGYIWEIISGGIDCLLLYGETSLENNWRSLQKEGREAYRKALLDNLSPQKLDKILLDYDVLIKSEKQQIQLIDVDKQKSVDLKLNMQGPRSFFGNISFFKEEIENLLDAGFSIHIFAGSEHQQNRLAYLLRDLAVEIHTDEISSGFSLPDGKLIAISENEIFGRKKRYKTNLKYSASKPIDTFIELQSDDYIVHLEYGIGIFRKIERINAAGRERDYIKIEYADKENVFIPIEQVNLLQKYIGQEGTPPRLDKLGGKTWESKKQRVKKSVEDLAKHLIELYAKRERAQGFSFSKDSDWQLEFEAAFPYEETEDQLSCIYDVKTDMEKPEPMDRLVCGDVGFGKTEIAIRAAFKAIVDGKQVAFLAPTTILAEQHYENIQNRFSSYPIQVDMLSRMVDKKNQKKIINSLSSGESDILIGTHRILQKDIAYKNLGLLIIDEEQRFGVKDKERIKGLKLNVDCISLSATPIPRTLYMSMLKIRDISLLRTPPLLRRPIRTIIEEFNVDTVREAIIHETDRGGQVFFLHNRVSTLEKTVLTLRKLLPELYIDFAHGKMAPHELEKKMHDFINRKFQVLVSTTIIENGIDIPNVNTIIIDRADRYGISQLYQLRGRVGRSNKEAYAYLMYPKNQVLSEIAMKRLKTISEHTDLGSGFKIAMKDMEIRGTGNILGREQHGQMIVVGLDMYLRMLDKAISKLSENKKEEIDYDVFLDLDYTGYIPNSYISDPAIKFDVYKKIASIKEKQEIDRIISEMNDKYGPIPLEMANLLYIAELKVLSRQLKISSLRERNGKVRIEFLKVADISIEKVMQLIKESGGNVTIDQKKPNVLLMKTEAISLKDKSLFILEKLQRLL
ncbi:MAG: transcription-repair coupling factor [Spirochaetia bacterium]|nr:transcription-repair coupling factor [Spirochaetia bacterium]